MVSLSIGAAFIRASKKIWWCWRWCVGFDYSPRLMRLESQPSQFGNSVLGADAIYN
jgi:hypothetical protein